MRIVVHLHVHSLDPSLGGMERSAHRVAHLLAAADDTRVVAHLFGDGSAAAKVARQVGVQNLALPPRGTPKLESLRARVLALEGSIRRVIAQEPEARHLVLSFYATSSGYLAQQAADRLGLPHVASLRGSDFHRDALSPVLRMTVAHVIEHADVLVTTNAVQTAQIRDRWNPQGAIVEIGNSLTELPEVHRPRPRPLEMVRIFTDTGVAYQKGTDILLDAVEALLREGERITLHVAGRIAPAESAVWMPRIAEFEANWGPAVHFHGHLKLDAVRQLLATCDLYVSASLSEGCSNAITAALCAALPVLATRVGHLAFAVPPSEHVRLVDPGDNEAYTLALREHVRLVRASAFVSGEAWVQSQRAKADPAEEVRAWQWAIDQAGVSRSRMSVPRALFVVHDGTGLGHLRRAGILARALSPAWYAVVVSGVPDAPVALPSDVTYVKVPQATPGADLELRTCLLTALVRELAPDLIVVDHLAAGKRGEWARLIGRIEGPRKILVWRGIMGPTRLAERDWLSPEQVQALDLYDHVFVACDPSVFRMEDHYTVPTEGARKLRYLGYVAPQIAESDCAAARAGRGATYGRNWVVCSAGGGAHGVSFVEACLHLASTKPASLFDIVMGPRIDSDYARRVLGAESPPNVRVHLSHPNLDVMHAAADVVICTGGYNAIQEALLGHAPLLVAPSQNDPEDEQYEQARALSGRRPIHLVTRVSRIPWAFDQLEPTFGRAATQPPIDTNGAAEFRALLERGGTSAKDDRRDTDGRRPRSSRRRGWADFLEIAPEAGALDRWLQAQARSSRPFRVLEVGCGEGVALLDLAKYGPLHLYGVNLRPWLGFRGIRDNLQASGVCEDHLPLLLFADASSALPFGEETMDFVYSQRAFPWFVDKANAVREIWRCLAPGGSALLHLDDARGALSTPRFVVSSERTTVDFGEWMEENFHGEAARLVRWVGRTFLRLWKRTPSDRLEIPLTFRQADEFHPSGAAYGCKSHYVDIPSE